MIKNTFTLKSLKSKCLSGKLSVPADKSISIRSLLIGAISQNISCIKNILKSRKINSTSR